jgi:hypothetical protein
MPVVDNGEGFYNLFLASSRIDDSYLDFDDEDHPNVIAFKDAKSKDQQLTFDASDGTHVFIPRSFGGWGNKNKRLSTSCGGYCLTHEKYEVYSPLTIKNIREVKPKTLENVPLSVSEKSMKDYDDSKYFFTPKKQVELKKRDYDDARAADIDPQTFDNAAYKRVMMLGASKDNVIEALKKHVPIEDYENSLLGNGYDHEAAMKDTAYREKKEDGTSDISPYHNHYAKIVKTNKKIAERAPVVLEKNRMFSDSDYNNEVQKLFKHHLTRLNSGNDTMDPQDRKWMLSECMKLNPQLKMDYDGPMADPILNTDNYNRIVKNLMSHHSLKNFHTTSIGGQIINNRKMNAVLNLASHKEHAFGFIGASDELYKKIIGLNPPQMQIKYEDGE